MNFPPSYFNRSRELNELQRYAIEVTRNRVVGTLLEVPKMFRAYHSLTKPKNSNFIDLEFHFLKPGYYLVVDLIPVQCMYSTCFYVVLDGECLCYVDKKEFEQRCSNSLNL